MLRNVWHLGFALSFALVPLRARAQAEPGEQQIAAGNELLAAGKAAYNAGRFPEALQDFEQAYQRTQRASILYRIGDTADKLGEHEKAVTAFQQYLDATPSASDTDFIQGRIAANRRALSNAEAPGPTPVSNAALSPAAAAQTASPSDPANAAPVDASAPRDGQDLKRAWWLWAGAGTVVIAAIVVIAIVVGSSSTHAVAPVKGNVGGTVNTLEGP